MHDLGSANDASTKDLANALVAQTHTQERALPDRVRNECVGNTGIGRGSGPGADEHTIGVQRIDAVDVDVVISPYYRACAELAQVLDEVVDERVVVIDHQDGCHGCFTLATR